MSHQFYNYTRRLKADSCSNLISPSKPVSSYSARFAQKIIQDFSNNNIQPMMKIKKLIQLADGMMYYAGTSIPLRLLQEYAKIIDEDEEVEKFRTKKHFSIMMYFNLSVKEVFDVVKDILGNATQEEALNYFDQSYEKFISLLNLDSREIFVLAGKEIADTINTLKKKEDGTITITDEQLLNNVMVCYFISLLGEIKWIFKALSEANMNSYLSQQFTPGIGAGEVKKYVLTNDIKDISTVSKNVIDTTPVSDIGYATLEEKEIKEEAIAQTLDMANEIIKEEKIETSLELYENETFLMEINTILNEFILLLGDEKNTKLRNEINWYFMNATFVQNRFNDKIPTKLDSIEKSLHSLSIQHQDSLKDFYWNFRSAFRKKRDQNAILKEMDPTAPTIENLAARLIVKRLNDLYSPMYINKADWYDEVYKFYHDSDLNFDSDNRYFYQYFYYGAPMLVLHYLDYIRPILVNLAIQKSDNLVTEN